MKILWVRHFFPHPPHGGDSILSLNVLRRLHRNHEIHIVAHSLPENRDIEIAGTAEYSTSYSAVEPVVHKRPLRPYIAQLGRELLFGKSEIVSPQMLSEVRRLLASGAFDVAVSDSVFVAPALYGSPFLLLAHNVETLLKERHAAVQTDPLLRWHYQIAASKVRRLEEEAFQRARRIVALSEVDAGIMRRQFGAKHVSVMTFGADIEGLRPPEPRDPPERDLIFVGAMDTDANNDGALWFCREVLPLIHRVRPETTLAIVGRSPEPAVQALAGDPRIVVSGRVPDVRPWIWSSRISVVPLRFGGGIRIKIYEAMAAQSPLVSTSIGAEGLRVSPERDILLADTPAEFAGQTLRLLNDAALRESIGRAGQELVSHNYSWDKAAQDIDAALEECAKVRLAGAKP